jgi:Mg2+-importing ATPase
MVLLYLVLVEAAKHFYYRAADARLAREAPARAKARAAARVALGLHHGGARVHRRATPFLVHTGRPKFRRPPGHGVAPGRR